jgi:hypothetical protein
MSKKTKDPEAQTMTIAAKDTEGNPIDPITTDVVIPVGLSAKIDLFGEARVDSWAAQGYKNALRAKLTTVLQKEGPDAATTFAKSYQPEPLLSKEERQAKKLVDEFNKLPVAVQESIRSGI